MWGMRERERVESEDGNVRNSLKLSPLQGRLQRGGADVQVLHA